DDVAQRYLGVTPAGATASDELDLGMGASPAQVAGERAWLVNALADDLEGTVEQRGMIALYRDLELPLIATLSRMERAGFAVSRSHLDSLAAECARRSAASEQEAFAALDGHEVNLA